MWLRRLLGILASKEHKTEYVTKYRPCIKEYNIETADHVVSVGEEEFEVPD